MNNTTRRLARTLIAFAAFGSLSPSMCLHAADYINLSVSDQITGGSATGGSFLWNNNGRFIVSDSPLSNGVPGQGSNTMVWDSTNHRFLAGIWWTESSLGGVGSAAFGTSSSAMGECSFAGGYLAQAYGFGSLAIGFGANAWEDSSIALVQCVTNSFHYVAS